MSTTEPNGATGWRFDHDAASALSGTYRGWHGASDGRRDGHEDHSDRSNFLPCSIGFKWNGFCSSWSAHRTASGWTVKYNELLIACYQGTWDACDRVVSDRGMISDTPIYDWAITCGGRLDRVYARRVSAQMFRNGNLEGLCSYVSRQ